MSWAKLVSKDVPVPPITPQTAAKPRWVSNGQRSCVSLHVFGCIWVNKGLTILCILVKHKAPFKSKLSLHYLSPLHSRES